MPRTFFKVVVAAAAGGELEVAAHRIENAQRRTSPAAVTLAELEAVTGLGFPEVLHKARPLGGF